MARRKRRELEPEHYPDAEEEKGLPPLDCGCPFTLHCSLCNKCGDHCEHVKGYERAEAARKSLPELSAKITRLLDQLKEDLAAVEEDATRSDERRQEITPRPK